MNISIFIKLTWAARSRFFEVYIFSEITNSKIEQYITRFLNMKENSYKFIQFLTELFIHFSSIFGKNEISYRDLDLYCKIISRSKKEKIDAIIDSIRLLFFSSSTSYSNLFSIFFTIFEGLKPFNYYKDYIQEQYNMLKLDIIDPPESNNYSSI